MSDERHLSRIHVCPSGNGCISREHVPRQLAGPARGDVSGPAGDPRRRDRPHLRRARAGGCIHRAAARGAWRPPGRRRGAGPRPGAGVRGGAPRADEARRGRPSAQHAPRRDRAGRGAGARGARADPRLAPGADRNRGGHAAPRRARSRRAPLPPRDQRHLGPRTPDRAHLRELPVERRGFGLQPGGRPRGPLALLPAPVPRCRALDPHAIRRLRHRGGDSRRIRPRSGRRLPRRRTG